MRDFSLLDSAIDEMERVLLGNKPREAEEIYLQNAIDFIEHFKKQPELNPDQQTVLDWLKTNVEQDNVSPMCAVFLLGEWQTRIGSKELRSVDIAYCRLNPKQQAQVLRTFADWIEQEEA
ncbi:hypothetical protein [Enterococcus faecalis]|uniref:hypothetical protein n=1 Tax=Enterococcus faecalis TaxID=1351 RepID=UPI003CFDB2F7